MKMRWQKFPRSSWPIVIAYGSLFLFLGALLFAQLDSLLPGYSANEAQAFDASQSLEAILDNPINAPFSLAIYGLTLISEHSYLLARIASVLVGVGVLAVFHWLVQRWYGSRTAFVGTLLFGTSAWFLHTTRLGTANVLLLTLLILVACGVWFKRTRNPFVLILCLIAAGLALYIPGMIWFVLLIVIWEWRQIDTLFKRNAWAVPIGTLLFLALLAPIIWAIYRTPSLAKQFAGLPADGWPNIADSLQRFVELPISIFFHTPANAETWLGTLPVLDAFAAAMLIIGVYLYIRYPRLSRVQLFLPILIVSWVLISLGGSVTLSILLPFLYITVAAGVSFMFDSWLNIFPKNPIAKYIGYGMMTIVMIAASGFQLRHYLLAWPNNDDTQAIFTLQETASSDTIKQSE